MRRAPIFSALVACGFAGAASAGTLTIESDKNSYNTGETIVITISGNSEGDIGDQISVALLHSLDATISAALGVRGPVGSPEAEDGAGPPDLFTQFENRPPQYGGPVHASRGANEGSCIDPAGPPPIRCLAWDQIFFGGSAAIDAGWERSILHYVAGGPGFATFEFVNDGTAGSFNFPGMASPPGGISVCICAIPEPTTGALLALGLLGLAGARRWAAA